MTLDGVLARLWSGFAHAGVVGLLFALLVLFYAFKYFGSEKPWADDYKATLILFAWLVVAGFLFGLSE